MPTWWCRRTPGCQRLSLAHRSSEGRPCSHRSADFSRVRPQTKNKENGHFRAEVPRKRHTFAKIPRIRAQQKISTLTVRLSLHHLLQRVVYRRMVRLRLRRDFAAGSKPITRPRFPPLSTPLCLLFGSLRPRWPQARRRPVYAPCIVDTATTLCCDAAAPHISPRGHVIAPLFPRLPPALIGRKSFSRSVCGSDRPCHVWAPNLQLCQIVY